MLHIYIDGTFITTKEFYQLLIILFYDKLTKTKIPAVYILTNNKYLNFYIKIFKKIKNLITIENSVKLNWKSITIDYESSLIESVNKVFNNIHIIGCMFHYIKNVKWIKIRIIFQKL